MTPFTRWRGVLPKVCRIPEQAMEALVGTELGLALLSGASRGLMSLAGAVAHRPFWVKRPDSLHVNVKFNLRQISPAPSLQASQKARSIVAQLV
jgi:hypothetical protein